MACLSYSLTIMIDEPGTPAHTGNAALAFRFAYFGMRPGRYETRTR
jgi:hypothetical protein